MTRGKGNRAPGWVAAYLRPWWPTADKTPNGRPGRDLENTPGVAWEIKTAAEWRPAGWRKQVGKYPHPGEIGVLAYLPPGLGEAHVGDAMAILPLRDLMPLLVAAGYAPAPIAPGRLAVRPEPGDPDRWRFGPAPRQPRKDTPQ